MEISSSTSSDNFQSLQHLEYSNTKYFQSQSYKRTQRFIPLTREIEKAMINFNGSESGTSISERLIFNTTSMSLVRGEVHNVSQKLPVSDQLVCKEKIDDVTKKSLNDYNTILQHVILHDANDELEIIVKDITEDQDKPELSVERIEKLEYRITKLEERLRFLLKNIPELGFIPAKKFKININATGSKLYSLTKTNSQISRKSLKCKDDKNEVRAITYNIYDDLFFKTREYGLNSLYYKKSLESLGLNKHSKWNPYVKPTYNALSTQDGSLKKLSMFLTS